MFCMLKLQPITSLFLNSLLQYNIEIIIYSRSNMNLNRYSFIDNAKAIGITLVVIGHVFPGNVTKFIYLFHMPLFFLLSGFLFKPQTIKKYSLKKVSRLLIPYVSFLLLLYFLYSILNLLFYGKLFHDIYNGLSDILYGGVALRGAFGVFWFTTTLFFSLIIFNFLACKLEIKMLLLVMIASYTLAFLNQYLAPDFKLPLGLNVCLYAIPLIGIGWFLKNHHTEFLLIAIVGFILFSVKTFIFHNLVSVDLKSTVYGLPLESTAIAIAFFYLIMMVSKKIPSNWLLTYIGNASITIMFTHQWFHVYMRELGLSNVYILTTLALTLSLLTHATLERSYKCRRYFLGQPQVTN